MIAVGPGVSAALDLLGDVVDIARLVPVDLDQGVVEGVGGVDRIHDLLLAAPTPPRGPPETAPGIPGPVVAVARAGLPVSRRQPQPGPPPTRPPHPPQV